MDKRDSKCKKFPHTFNPEHWRVRYPLSSGMHLAPALGVALERSGYEILFCYKTRQRLPCLCVTMLSCAIKKYHMSSKQKFLGYYSES